LKSRESSLNSCTKKRLEGSRSREMLSYRSLRRSKSNGLKLRRNSRKKRSSRRRRKKNVKSRILERRKIAKRKKRRK